MAIIAAMSNSNGGLYAALMGEFGNERDVGATSILFPNDAPYLYDDCFGYGRGGEHSCYGAAAPLITASMIITAIPILISWIAKK